MLCLLFQASLPPFYFTRMFGHGFFVEFHLKRVIRRNYPFVLFLDIQSISQPLSILCFSFSFFGSKHHEISNFLVISSTLLDTQQSIKPDVYVLPVPRQGSRTLVFFLLTLLPFLSPMRNIRMALLLLLQTALFSWARTNLSSSDWPCTE